MAQKTIPTSRPCVPPLWGATHTCIFDRSTDTCRPPRNWSETRVFRPPGAGPLPPAAYKEDGFPSKLDSPQRRRSKIGPAARRCWATGILSRMLPSPAKSDQAADGASEGAGRNKFIFSSSLRGGYKSNPVSLRKKRRRKNKKRRPQHPITSHCSYMGIWLCERVQGSPGSSPSSHVQSPSLPHFHGGPSPCSGPLTSFGSADRTFDQLISAEGLPESQILAAKASISSTQ